MPERKWSVRDRRTGKHVRLAEVTDDTGTRWHLRWSDAGDGSKFTAVEAVVVKAFMTLFAERFGDEKAGRRFAVVAEVAHA
jgi:IS5 family transposase